MAPWAASRQDCCLSFPAPLSCSRSALPPRRTVPPLSRRRLSASRQPFSSSSSRPAQSCKARAPRDGHWLIGRAGLRRHLLFFDVPISPPPQLCWAMRLPPCKAAPLPEAQGKASPLPLTQTWARQAGRIQIASHQLAVRRVWVKGREKLYPEPPAAERLSWRQAHSPAELRRRSPRETAHRRRRWRRRPHRR